MVLMSQPLLWMLLIQYVSSLRVLSEKKREPIDQNQAIEERKILRRLLSRLVNTKSYLTGGRGGLRRKIDHHDVEQANNVIQGLSEKMGPDEIHQFLSNAVNTMHNDDAHHKMVEDELHHTETRNSIALHDTPYIQKEGKIDYLVFDKDPVQDPFVTVVPNNIYYDIEKSCANWMDDCSLQGIRARLLQKMRSPYK